MEGNVFEGRRAKNWISKSCNSKVTKRIIRRRSASKSDQKKIGKIIKTAENYVCNRNSSDIVKERNAGFSKYNYISSTG